MNVDLILIKSVLLVPLLLFVSITTVHDQPTSEQTTLWIVGDSHIKRAKKAAKRRPGGYNLSLTDLGLTVQFVGKSGACLSDLHDMITDAQNEHGHLPYMVIIHLGTNDLDTSTRMGMYHKNMQALKLCLDNLANTVVIFSEILPRQSYSYWVGDQEAADRNRRKVNGEMCNKVYSSGLRFIRHYNISPNDDSQYVDNTHLTTYGYHLMLSNFENAVRYFYADHEASIYS